MNDTRFSNVMEYEKDLWLCARCGDCSLADKIVASNREIFHPCAVKNVLGFEAYTARGRIMVINDLLAGKLELDDDLVNWAFTCTTCKNCQETCTATADGIRMAEITEALRRDLVDKGLDMPKHRIIEEYIEKEGNPYKEPREKRLELFGERQWPERAEVVYFVGCTSAYREREIAIDTVALLDKAGVDFTILPDEECCGSVMHRLGREGPFNKSAQKNIKAIEKTKAKYLITACAGCYRTWKIDIPENGHKFKFEVLHITEFLDKLISEKRIAFEAPNGIRVTYHDPCHLGRHSEVYEAPRRVIQSVKNVELVEMMTNKRYAHCCGAGGGVKSSHGELADKIAARRINEAEDTQAELLITACPFCLRGLHDGADYIKSSLRIIDIPQFLLPYVIKGVIEVSEEENPLKQEFMDYLRAHPKIFDGLKPDAVIDYIIEDDRFHVRIVKKGQIEVNPIRAENPDVELTFSEGAVRELIQIPSEDEYAARFGQFFKEPTDEKWIKFNLRRNIVKLLMKGYRKFAQKAGLI